jgi:hypothetical protein
MSKAHKAMMEVLFVGLGGVSAPSRSPDDGEAGVQHGDPQDEKRDEYRSVEEVAPAAELLMPPSTGRATWRPNHP